MTKKDSFSNLINDPDRPVLVDFFATWCQPCKMMVPILEEVSQNFEGKVRVIKIDVDLNKAVSQQYGIRSIPTMILFYKGEILWRESSVSPASKIIQKIESLVYPRGKVHLVGN